MSDQPAPGGPGGPGVPGGPAGPGGSGNAAEPPPLPGRMTDPVPVILVGSAVWLVLGVVLAALASTGPGVLGVWFWAAVCGVALGALGLLVLGLQRRANRRGSKGAQKL